MDPKPVSALRPPPQRLQLSPSPAADISEGSRIRQGQTPGGQFRQAPCSPGVGLLSRRAPLRLGPGFPGHRELPAHRPSPCVTVGGGTSAWSSWGGMSPLPGLPPESPAHPVEGVTGLGEDVLQGPLPWSQGSGRAIGSSAPAATCMWKVLSSLESWPQPCWS